MQAGHQSKGGRLTVQAGHQSKVGCLMVQAGHQSKGGGCRLTQQLRIRGLGGGEGGQQRRQAVQLRLRLQPPQRHCARAPPESPPERDLGRTACPVPSAATQAGACPFHCLRTLQRLAPLREAKKR